MIDKIIFNRIAEQERRDIAIYINKFWEKNAIKGSKQKFTKQMMQTLARAIRHGYYKDSL